MEDERTNETPWTLALQPFCYNAQRSVLYQSFTYNENNNTLFLSSFETKLSKSFLYVSLINIQTHFCLNACVDSYRVGYTKQKNEIHIHGVCILYTTSISKKAENNRVSVVVCSR